MADSTEIEMAWAAGLFEGEGSVCRASGTRSQRVYIHLQMQMTDKDTLDKFARIVGAGNVRGPWRKADKPHWKPKWKWSLAGAKAVELVTDERFARHLCSRRSAKIAEILEAIRVQPPPWSSLRKTHCIHGHAFTDWNSLLDRDGKRHCRLCGRRRATEWARNAREQRGVRD